MVNKRRKTDKLTFMGMFKDISSIIVTLGAIVGVFYGAIAWYNGKVVKKHDSEVKIVNNEKQIRDVGYSLHILDKNNSEQHEQIKKDIAVIKNSVGNIDKNVNNLNQLILHRISSLRKDIPENGKKLVNR